MQSLSNFIQFPLSIMNVVSMFLNFQLEASGDEMIALCSKTYILKDRDSYKFSCKGINKSALESPMDSYQNVLNTELSGSGCNRGFRVRGNNIFTYAQTRSGLSYYYCKRQLLNDGVSTIPLTITLSPWNIPDYVGFWGTDHPLSNYYPTRLNLYNQWFDNASEAYNFQLRLQNGLNDEIIREEKLSNIKWFENRNSIMKEILIEKMSINECVRKALSKSKTLPLMYCTANRYWGLGMSPRLVAVSKTHRGANVLGQLWEEIRELRWEEIQKRYVMRCNKCKQKRSDVKFVRDLEEVRCDPCSK